MINLNQLLYISYQHYISFAANRSFLTNITQGTKKDALSISVQFILCQIHNLTKDFLDKYNLLHQNWFTTSLKWGTILFRFNFLRKCKYSYHRMHLFIVQRNDMKYVLIRFSSTSAFSTSIHKCDVETLYHEE